MPCYDLHVYFGDTLSHSLKNTVPAFADGDVACAAFRAGLVGPDPYFFDLVPPPLFRSAEKRTGNGLHEKPSDEVFAALFRSLRAAKLKMPHHTEALTAFGLGFLCHYVLDSTLHPLICTVSGNGMDHTRFETALDSVLLTKLGASLPMGSETKLLPARPLITRPKGLSNSPLDAIDTAMTDAVCKLFGYDVTGAYRRSFFKDRLLHDFLYDPSGRGHAFWHGVEHALRLHEGLISGFLCCPQSNIKQDDRFFALAKKESDRALELLQIAFARAKTLFGYAVPALAVSDNVVAEENLQQMTCLMAGSTMSHGFKA